MRVCLIKTSSMGDVVHTLPALTDALRAHPALSVDWLVEESFAAIPGWHPAVKRVLPVAIRRWRKSLWAMRRDPQWCALRDYLRNQHYDVIVDAQGLLKSAWLGLLTHGKRVGYDRRSVREPLSALFYEQTFSVAKGQHAVERTRQLMAQALSYTLPTQMGDYALDKQRVSVHRIDNKKLLFLHGTTWASKHYPEVYWTQLAQLAVAEEFDVCLPWGNDIEKARAERIAVASGAQVLAKLSLPEVAQQIASAAGVICVDSGLGHLACAFERPTISLYGATNPALTSTYGRTQHNLAAQFVCAPCLQRECRYHGASTAQPACYDSLPPAVVWSMFKQQLTQITVT